MGVADFIRTDRARLARLWAAEVASPPVLLDRISVLLDGLADWIDGERGRGERAFATLVEAHALQRLGYGVGIETLTREYSKLRVVLSRELLALPASDAIRAELIRFHEAMDRALTEAMRRYAAQRDEVRERFIGILGHDLRDPLSTIKISANVLADDAKLSSDQRLVAARIRGACDRMQRMVNDVLDFARSHLGDGIPAHPVRDDLGAICRVAVDEVAAANPERAITLATQGDLTGAFDRDRVIQALTNLLANAVHHGTGPIELRACQVDRDAIVTEVTSHGDVIPDDVRQRIFDPFARGETTDTLGLGLGLYIVQQIAFGHGATCEVASTSSATTFTIRWPRAVTAERRAG